MVTYINNFSHLVSQIKWQDWATVVGVLLGVVSLIAYFDQRRASKAQANLLEFARRHVAKDISEEKLQALQQQEQSLREKIEREIPLLARRAVLKDQAEANAKATASHFLEWKRLSEELGLAATASDLPPEIQQAILDRIVPQYQKREEIEAVRNRITVFSVGLALTGSLLPYPIDKVLPLFFAFPLGVSVYQLWRLTTTREERIAGSLKIIVALYVLLAMLFICGGCLILLVPTLTQTGKYIAWGLVGFGAVILALTKIVANFLKKII